MTLKIAQIAPPWIEVPPLKYGGIELVVSVLADGLVARGHDVTLFASGGSTTSARLVSYFDPAPGAERIGRTYVEVLHATHAYERVRECDVVHDHSGMVGLAIATHLRVPVVHTLHGLLNDEALRWYRTLGDRVALVAISDSQMRSAPDLNYVGRVYNGIPLERYPMREKKDDFVLFLGRVNQGKGPELAVEAAKRARVPLVMAAARKDESEKQYWRDHVEPLLTGDEEILDQISHEQKVDLMGRARAVLMPIRWDEPFGLVMAEANACGTPVIAFPRGAAPEVVADGETGFLVQTPQDMADAIARCDEIDPATCRARVERLFSAEAMVRGYEEIFERIAARR